MHVLKDPQWTVGQVRMGDQPAPASCWVHGHKDRPCRLTCTLGPLIECCGCRRGHVRRAAAAGGDQCARPASSRRVAQPYAWGRSTSPNCTCGAHDRTRQQGRAGGRSDQFRPAALYCRQAQDMRRRTPSIMQRLIAWSQRAGSRASKGDAAGAPRTHHLLVCYCHLPQRGSMRRSAWWWSLY